MRILHVLSSARSEGTPRLVLDWLSIKDHEQAVLFLNPGGELMDAFQEKNQVYTNDQFVPSFKHAHKIARLTKKTCKDFNPDLLIAWPTGHSQWIHWGGWQAGVKKKITHIGNPPGASFFGRYLATALTFYLSYVFNVQFIACSKYVKEAYFQLGILPRKNLHAVYNAIQLENFYPDWTQQNDSSVMVATLEKHKDHETLIDASIHFPEEVGTVFCFGEGSLRESLEEKIKLSSNKIKLMGSSNNIPEVLRKHKVFVLSTTEQEGFGTVLIEALASGCQIVATDVKATREVLNHSEWGLLVAPKHPQALAEAIFNARKAPVLDAKSWEKRQGYLRQFDVKNMIHQYLALA